MGVNPDGKTYLGLNDANEKPRVVIYVSPDGTPSIGLSDANGKPIWAAE